jgi:hypothetical protein
MPSSLLRYGSELWERFTRVINRICHITDYVYTGKAAEAQVFLDVDTSV